MPKAKDDVTPAEVQRAKTMRGAGKGYKEIAKAIGLASEKVAWHVVNSAGKASGKASGKAPKRVKAPVKAKAQPKARKAPSASVASPRGPKKASQKAPAAAPTDGPTNPDGAAESGKRLDMLDPNGGDRPVARPTTFRPVPKPKATKAAAK